MSVMIYANSESVYNKIRKHTENSEKIVLVSTNISLLNSQREKTTGVILDSENMFFSKETFEIIEQFNRIIQQAVNRSDNYLYEIPLRIEGGIGNKLQSFLYVVDIFLKIVKKYQVEKIYCENIAGNLEHKALLCVADGVKIPICVYNNSTLKETVSHSTWLPFRTLKTVYSNISTVRRIRKVSAKCNKEKHSECFDVGFVLLGSRKKYINWSMRQMSFYDKEVETAVFCYRVEDENDMDLLLNMGKTVKFVEAYGDWNVIIKSYWNYICNKQSIQKELKKILKVNRVIFQGIDVTDDVFDLVQLYISWEKFEDVIYDGMIGEFIKYNRFKLLTGNGDSNFASIKSFYFHAKEKKFPFWGFADFTGTDILEFPAEMMALERYPFIWKFVFSDPRKKGIRYLENAEWKGDVYIHSDTTYINTKDGLNENISTGSNILWAPSNTMHGLYSIVSFMEDNRVIIENLDRLPCFLKVKYHFSQDEEIIKAINTMCNECKVEWIDRKEMIEPYIEWADIIFTTVSTVILDAMSQGKFVVCIVDDLEQNYVGDLKDYCYVVSREDIDYQAILYDLDFRRQWIKKQNDFMEILTSTKNDVSIVEVLNDYLNKLDEYVLPRERET